MIDVSKMLRMNADNHGLGRVQAQMHVLKEHLKDTLMNKKRALQLKLPINDSSDTKVGNIRKVFEMNRKRFDLQSRK